MSNIEVILFDADNTLFDHTKATKYNLRKTFNDFGITYNGEMEQEYRLINRALWKQYNDGQITKEYLSVSRFKKFFDKYNINFDPELFDKTYSTNLSENYFLIDQAENVCKILNKNFKIVIVTNGMSKVAHRKIEKSEINKYISQVFVSDDIGFPKPHIEFFEYVFKNLKHPREKMIMVGDDLTTDIDGGNRVGLETYWINRLNIKNNTNIRPKYEIKNLVELIPLLN